MKRRVVFTVALVLLNGLATASAQVRHEIHFPDLPGYQTLKCDFHTHTVFSDGAVWPTVCVDEALVTQPPVQSSLLSQFWAKW